MGRRVADVAACSKPPVSTAEIERALLASLDRNISMPILVDAEPITPQDGVDGDFARGAALPDGAVLLRTWRNRPCLVASQRQARLPRFAVARAVSEAAGWPVAIRRSGGTAVVHRPGVVNLSLLATAGDTSVGRDYQALLAILRDMLAGIGIDCDQGEVPGAYCDGRYNLRWRGRKLAGTAGSIAQHQGRTIRMFHASLLVGGPIADDLEVIHRFESALGEPTHYAPAAHVSVAQILGGRHHIIDDLRRRDGHGEFSAGFGLCIR